MTDKVKPTESGDLIDRSEVDVGEHDERGKFLTGGKPPRHREGGPRPRFRSLRRLPRFEQIHEMLAKGLSPDRVARVIQAEWGMELDVRPASLSKRLQRYRAACVTEVEALNAYDHRYIDRIKAKFGDVETVLERLMWAINIQTQRVTRFYEREKEARVPGDDPERDPGLHKELRLLADIILGTGEFMMEAGLVKRAPKGFQGLVGLGGTLGIDMVDSRDAADAQKFQLQDEQRRRATFRKATLQAMKLLKGGPQPEGNGKGGKKS